MLQASENHLLELADSPKREAMKIKELYLEFKKHSLEYFGRNGSL